MGCEPFKGKLPDGTEVTAIVCGANRKRRCSNCRNWANLLCDEPDSSHKTGTCDKPLCSSIYCRRHEKGKDYCRWHDENPVQGSLPL